MVRIDGCIRVLVPEHLFADATVEQVLPRLRESLSSPDNEAVRTLLRLVVSEIKIYVDEAIVTGTNFGVVRAISHGLTQTSPTKGASEPAVPSFIPKWCPGTELNRRPCA